MAGITAWAQTLAIGPAGVDRGSSNIFRIVYTPRAGKPVAAFQWELVIPKSLQVEAKGVVSGAAAESSGKSIQCANRKDPNDGSICTCILAGGNREVAEGTIAIVKFSAADDASPGQATVRLRKILGVSADLQEIHMADAATPITIR